MQHLTVKLIQTFQFWEDKEQNFKHFETKFLSQIAPKSADLVLLPEMFNTGFSIRPEKLAETTDGQSVKWLQHWAKKLTTVMGASLIIKENGNYFNRFVLVDEHGIVAQYNKRHLFRMAAEHDQFEPGKKRVIFELKGWKLMLQICYDLRFPVFSRNQEKNGEKEYDALIYTANWPAKRAAVWDNLLVSRAIENQAYVIGLNRVGTDGENIAYKGRSVVIDPWGNPLNELDDQERIITQTLQRETLEEIKKKFPAYLDADEFSLK